MGTVVWVANRNTPITDKSGMLELGIQGNLLIRIGDNIVIWSSNSTVSAMHNNTVVVGQLLDIGNLVVWDRSDMDESVIWQSFDYPGNTLPGMKFGKDLVTGRERVLTPWKSEDDPSPGEYLHWLDTNRYPQMFVRHGSVIRWRHGPWNGLRFQGWPMENPSPIYMVQFVCNENEIYYKYEIKSSVVQRVILLPDDTTVHFRWMDQIQDWAVHTIGATKEGCGGYGICGTYGSCSVSRYPPCSCMAGFWPRVPHEWDRANGSSGCERKQALDCGSGSSFKKISGVVFPDTRHSWYNSSMTLEECEMARRMNCNCTAYANSDIRNGGSGCLLWFDELMDTTENGDKHDLYIKLASSELAGNEYSHSSFNKKKRVVTLVLSTTIVVLLLFATTYACMKKEKRLHMKERGERHARDEKDSRVRMEDLDELPLFSLNKIVKATDNLTSIKRLENVDLCGIRPLRV